MAGRTRVPPTAIAALFAAIALNDFYWYAAPSITGSLGQLFGLTLPPGLMWVIRGVVLALTVVWIMRTNFKEERYIAHKAASQTAALGATAAQQGRGTAQGGAPEVTILPGDKRIAVEAGQSLLEVCEHNKLPIEAGCRMGVCGADPVAIAEGMEYLSPVGDDERATLERLGLGENTRMACCARVQGPVSLALKPEPRAPLPHPPLQPQHTTPASSASW